MDIVVLIGYFRWFMEWYEFWDEKIINVYLIEVVEVGYCFEKFWYFKYLFCVAYLMLLRVKNYKVLELKGILSGRFVYIS